MNTATIGRRASRLLIALVASLAIASMLAATASAAGKPLVKAGAPSSWTLNELKSANASINPNGAATTYEFEYGTTMSFGSTTGGGSLPAGSEAVGVSTPLRALNPNSVYYYRAKATNQYGTTFGPTQSSGTGAWFSSGKFPATYSSSGTFKVELKTLGVSVTCNETGSGTIGSVGGLSDEYTLNLSGCALASQPSCKVTAPYPIKLNANFTSKEGILVVIDFDEATCSAFDMSISAAGAFTMPAAPGGLVLEFPSSLTGSSQWGLHKVDLTSTSKWVLTGANAGKTFTWE